MDMAILNQRYLTRMRIVAKIPANGKLDTTDGINIYNFSFTNWVWRKARGDGKLSTTTCLTTLFTEISEFSNQLMISAKIEPESIKFDKKCKILASLAERLQSSIFGLHNLIDTYKFFPRTAALLESVEHDIIVPQFKQIYNFLPPEYLTDNLKSSILLCDEKTSPSQLSTPISIYTQKMHKPGKTPSPNKTYVNLDTSPQMSPMMLPRSILSVPLVNQHEKKKKKGSKK
jgi:hypothetical protein